MQLQSLLHKKLLMVTGKGGIGKTLVTATLGAYAASKGLRVCLIEAAAQDQIAPLFGHKAAGHQYCEVLPNLFCFNLEAHANFRDYVTKYLGLPALLDKIFSRPLVTTLIDMLPGIAEIMLLGRLYYTCKVQKEHAFDLVIYDGFAFGHFLTLMTTPDAVIDAGFIGPVERETKLVKEFLADGDACGILSVATPESLVVKETLEFAEKLRAQVATPLLGIVLNRMWEIPPAAQIPQPAGPLASLSEYLHYRAHTQEQSLTALKQGLASTGLKSSQLYGLRDLGVWPEPLTVAAASQWWQSPLRVMS